MGIRAGGGAKLRRGEIAPMKLLMANCGAGETYTECAAQRNTAEQAQKVANACKNIAKQYLKTQLLEMGGTLYGS